jgi:hypothetical protein
MPCDLLQVASALPNSSNNNSSHSSNLPPGNYCTDKQRITSCLIDVTYCCLGSYNLSSISPDWKMRFGIEPPTAEDSGTTAAAAAAAVLPQRSGSSSNEEKASPDAYVIALAVVLPVLTVMLVVALLTVRHALRARWQGGCQQGSRGPNLAADASYTPRNPADAALLLPSRVGMPAASSPAGAAAAAAAERSGSRRSDEQPLLKNTLSCDTCAVSPFAQQAWQQQLESQQSNTTTAASGAATAGAGDLAMLAGGSGNRARPLVSLWLMRGRTMPADLLARAVDQFHAAQQRQEGDDGGGRGGGGGASGGSSSNSPEPPDTPLKR